MRTLQLLMGRGRWDAGSLAEELECSRRTVYRILETLSAAGVPWYFDEKLRAYRVRPGYRTVLFDEQAMAASGEAADRREFQNAAKDLLAKGRLFSESLDDFLNICETLIDKQTSRDSESDRGGD